MRRIAIYSIIFLLTGECVDPANIKVPFAGGYLVVDGSISNDSGPYTINLFHATGLSESQAQATPERAAQITLIDDLGNQEPLFEFDAGIYKTTHAAFQGQIGRQYHIRIKTSAGKEFESDPELLRDAGTIDNLYYEFEYHDEYNGKEYVPANRFKIYIDGTGSSISSNLMKWRMNGTYKVETFPQWVHNWDERGPLCLPRPCHGYCFPLACSGQTVFYARGACQFLENAPCTCCECWVSETGSAPVISDDQLIVDSKFNRVFVANVPVTYQLFFDKYYVEVQQTNLSQTVYDFWRIIRIQKTGTASIFQPVNGKARGNIHPINNEDDVIGIFSASTISKKSIFLKKEFVPYRIYQRDTLLIDCRTLRNSSNVKPSFWQ